MTYRARREGIRRFSALVQTNNPEALGLAEGVGETRRRFDSGEVELVIEIPPKRGIGARLALALRAAASETLVPAQTLAHRVAVGVRSSPRPPARPGHPIRTIVVGANGSETGAEVLAVALQLAASLESELHVVSAYGPLEAPSEAEALPAEARRAVRARGWRPSPTRGVVTPPTR